MSTPTNRPAVPGSSWLLIGAVVVAVVLVFVVLLQARGEQVPAAAPATTQDLSGSSAEPLEPTTPPGPDTVADPGDGAQGPAPTSPAPPSTGPGTAPPLGEQSTATTAGRLVATDAELADPDSPVYWAARYVMDAKSVDYRIEPGAWVEEAEYLTDGYREYLESIPASDRGWEEVEEAQYRSFVRDPVVSLEEGGSQDRVFAVVTWDVEVLRTEQRPTIDPGAGSLVELVRQDGTWLVAGESFLGE